ncbi:MAG: diguanylate cyclase domain-containing protein [Maricaulaceae bacterium]
MTQSFCEPARRRSVGDETAEIGADFAAHIDTLERAHAAAARMIGRIDAITLMPNRLQFIDDLSERPAKGAPPPATLVMLTLADAKPYNRLLRVLGHSYAEDFIRAGAERLQSLLGPHVLVYHVSLLSFAFLVDGDPSRVEAIAADVASGFDAALDCRSLPVNTTVGIGLTALPEALTDPAEPLRAALAAVQDSRKQAMRWAWYNRHSDAATVRAFRLLTDLSAALEQPDELELVFQPRLALESGVRASAEA